MAGDRQLFKRAKTKWESLRDEGNFSLSAELGKTAIISSFFTDEPPDTETGITELEAFRSEAFELAKRIQASGGRTELAIDATRDDITDLIQDPDVATMYMIGNGSLSNLIIAERDYYDWLNVSAATTHLKQGSFIQRQCGGLTRIFNAPLGLFAVSDPRNVHAAFDAEFYPLSLDDPVNEKIQPVFDTPHISYDMVKALGSTVL
ncbi:MAG TPA: hypothetical protein VFM05_03880 [Candidatus Saccharimonadales bacterium]|nr:hypothetical protein [Candidatus Saccharimonadales bacterium]